jgi:hypothetical protein
MSYKVTVKLESKIFQSGTLRRELMDAVLRAAFAVEAGAKLRIKQGAKTGRTYRRGSIKRRVGEKRAREFREMGLRQSRTKPGSFVVGYRIHRASAPGESPASDSGHLANSIRTRPPKPGGNRIKAEVVVGAIYGRRLEEGGGRIAARPYLAPAVEEVRPQFLADVSSAISDSLS